MRPILIALATSIAAPALALPYPSVTVGYDTGIVRRSPAISSQDNQNAMQGETNTGTGQPIHSRNSRFSSRSSLSQSQSLGRQPGPALNGRNNASQGNTEHEQPRRRSNSRSSSRSPSPRSGSPDSEMELNLIDTRQPGEDRETYHYTYDITNWPGGYTYIFYPGDWVYINGAWRGIVDAPAYITLQTAPNWPPGPHIPGATSVNLSDDGITRIGLTDSPTNSPSPRSRSLGREPRTSPTSTDLSPPGWTRDHPDRVYNAAELQPGYTYTFYPGDTVHVEGHHLQVVNDPLHLTIQNDQGFPPAPQIRSGSQAVVRNGQLITGRHRR